MPSWIAQLVQLDRRGDDFRASAAFGVGPRLYGGLIAAQALAAAAATVDSGRLPQSLHAYFIKGGQVGVDVEFSVEITRDGRSFNTRRVTALQDGVAILEMMASFHLPETTTDWQRPEPARLALSDATVVTKLPVRWADHFEIRVAPGHDGHDEWPVQPFWFRTREPVENDAVLRACALTFISDMGLVSSARPRDPALPGPRGAASLDHALWLHRPTDPHQWHRYDTTAVSHSDARGLARGSIHRADGTLIASVAQESLWRI
ncbi:thioesterase family protein [Mycobacterium sp. CVI_P3]|uniref:Thioesterase family protein n=1 Tax=Mycobacterium pinniadriaticum TaxID=2994102 RepID=A0ABT3S8U4_9MYCO|nr:acyl-CoA thioesterase domain-containing protein [Mycobacterium pinniadriaticum]MCX2929497.1 thioesterase family protein [Mycobacterium pinniadriaticum]MCX2935921.1 thioesterase family protein [Mycobacterium pinniadriaticum]